MFLHATAVALRIGQSWQAVVLRGPSGVGKSDLALRLIDAGGRLVADDQTHVAVTDGVLFASAPPVLAGRLEVRGIGIIDLPEASRIDSARITLLVDLVPSSLVERMPDPAHEMMLGVALPLVRLAPFEASAVAKLNLAMTQMPAA